MFGLGVSWTVCETVSRTDNWSKVEHLLRGVKCRDIGFITSAILGFLRSRRTNKRTVQSTSFSQHEITTSVA